MQIKDQETARGLTSRLVLRRTRREDTAVFVCKAENRFGSSQRVVHLVVQGCQLNFLLEIQIDFVIFFLNPRMSA